MLASVKKSAVSFKSAVVKAKNISRRWVRTHRMKIGIISTIIAAIILTIALILAAYKGVDITNRAVIINYTQQKILDTEYTNEVHLIGLNSQYFNVPIRKFIIYFQDTPVPGTESWSPKITARSQQGTKLIVSARVSCQISNSIGLKQFLENYGLDWRTYAIQKSKNVIIQNIANFKFYQLNNSLLISAINTQFAGYILNINKYPFTFSMLTLKIEYPAGSFSVNNTLGIQVLRLKSQYSQLLQSYNSLASKISGTNETDLTNSIANISSRIGSNLAEVRIMDMQVKNLDNNWYTGMEVLQRIYGTDVVGLRRYLWLYFQKIYNGTYNNYTLF